MTGERLYDDEEVAAILERATTDHGGAPRDDGPPVPRSAQGMTLRELEDIGREVGILPERIAEAARFLETGIQAPVERFLGATRSVARTVRVARAPTELEWAQLVADLRRTFGAKGKVDVSGELRSWSNGNLQLHVEPEGDGHVIRMFTRKGNVTQFTLLGGAFSIMAAVVGFGALVGTGPDTLAKAALFAAIGLGTLTWVRATLPGWARERAEQMEGLAQRIQRMLNTDE